MSADVCPECKEQAVRADSCDACGWSLPQPGGTSLRNEYGVGGVIPSDRIAALEARVTALENQHTARTSSNYFSRLEVQADTQRKRIAALENALHALFNDFSRSVDLSIDWSDDAAIHVIISSPTLRRALRTLKELP